MIKTKKKGGKKRVVSHRQARKNDAQISNSRKTKSHDLDISLRRNASRLFSQLKNERDRQGGERKNKNRIILRGGGNKHLNSRRCAKYIFSWIV